MKNPWFLYAGFYCGLNIVVFVFFFKKSFLAMLNLKFDRILTINFRLSNYYRKGIFWVVLFSQSFYNCLLVPNTANAVKNEHFLKVLANAIHKIGCLSLPYETNKCLQSSFFSTQTKITLEEKAYY